MNDFDSDTIKKFLYAKKKLILIFIVAIIISCVFLFVLYGYIQWELLLQSSELLLHQYTPSNTTFQFMVTRCSRRGTASIKYLENTVIISCMHGGLREFSDYAVILFFVILWASCGGCMVMILTLIMDYRVFKKEV